MTRNCAVCGKPFEGARPSAKFCGATCRKRSSRGVGPPQVSYEAPELPQVKNGDLPAAVLAELTAAGKHNTALGQQALRLAEQMCGFETGGGLAALSRELRAVMADALQGMKASGDPVDELKALRERKRAG